MCRSCSSSSAFPARLLFLRSLSLGSGVYELGRCPKTRVWPTKVPQHDSSHLFPLGEPSALGRRAPVCLGFALPCAPRLFGVGERGAAEAPTLFNSTCVHALTRPWLPKPCARGLFAPSSFGCRAVPCCRREAGKEVNGRSFLALKWL